MPRTCTICTHAQKEEIDKLLVAGTPFRNIAGRFGASPSAVFRHKHDHLPTALVAAYEARGIAHGETLLEQLRGLQERACHILDQAADSGDLRTALMAIREARGCVELIGKATGELVERHAHLHAHATLPPDLALELSRRFAEVAEVMREQEPLIRERMMRHVYEGPDALPCVLTSGGKVST
jgi:hypothetical protein